MIDTVVIATDGSESVERAVTVALDLAHRFDAEVHALCVVDSGEVNSSPETLREEFHDALEEQAETALESVREHTDGSVVTAVREGRPGRRKSGVRTQRTTWTWLRREHEGDTAKTDSSSEASPNASFEPVRCRC